MARHSTSNQNSPSSRNNKHNRKPIAFSNRKSWQGISGYFQFSSLGATFKKEIIGGTTSFLAILYILSSNPAILVNATSIDNPTEQMNYFGIFLSTALTSFLTTFVMGLAANVPVVLTPTMGMNTIFTYSIANQGLGFEGAMIAIMFSNILFTIITLTPIKATVLRALPKSLTLCFTLAVGLFIAYVGLQEIGLYKLSNGLPIASLAILKENYPMILIGLGTLALMVIFHFKNVTGGVALSLLLGFVVALVIANTVSEGSSLVADGGPFAGANVRSGFTWYYDWAGWTSNIKMGWSGFGKSAIWTNPVFYISILIVTIMEFFDAVSAIGTLIHQLDRPNPEKLLHKAMVVDASCGIVNGALAVSPIGGVLESSSGISQGAKTGFASIISSMWFLVAIAIAPIFKMVPTFVSGAACVYIGLIIAPVAKQIEWLKPEFAFAAVMTIVGAMTTYTLINGVAFGIITYTFVMLVTKKAKSMNIVMWPLCLLMIVYFVALAFFQS